MSRNVKTNSNVKKPYCKVCHDAGKPESEYSNHWVRSLPDRSGKTTVTCPTLLSNECRYCYKLGHTAKFCPVIEKNKKDQDKAERIAARKEEEAQKKVKIENSTPAKRGFAALQEDSSDSEAENIQVSVLPTIVIEEYPSLGASMKPKMAVHLPSVKPEIKTGWAAVAAKPKSAPVEDHFLAQLEERSMIKNLPQSALKPKAAPMPSIKSAERDYTKKIYTTNWADWSDSDSDEEEEEAQVAPSGPPMPYKKVAVNMTGIEYDSDW